MKNMLVRARSLVLSSFVVVAVSSSGCTAITDETATQCRSQRDCLDRGPEFADTTCSVRRVCEKITAENRACTTNQECIDRNGGAPYTCRKDGKCVSLLSTNCQRVFADKEDLVDNNIVYIGVTYPNNEDGRQAQFAVDLARAEIKRAGKLAGATPDGPRRPLGIIGCNGEELSASVFQSMLEHLTNNVQVPYAISGYTSFRVLQAANWFMTRDTVMTTQNSTAAVTFLKDNDLVFRLGFSESQNVQGYTPFIRDYLTQKMRDEGMLGAEPIRIAIMRTLNSLGESMTETISKTLAFNGTPQQPKTFTENLADGNLIVIGYGGVDNPVDFPNPDNERAKAISQVLQFKPHIILFANEPPVAAATWLNLQRVWPAGTPRPYFMHALTTFAAFIPTVMAQFPNEEARKKFFGLRTLPPDFQRPEFQRWADAAYVRFPEAVGTNFSTATVQIYDGVYLFAYALAAIKNATLGGVELARGMRRVANASGGQPIQWGPDDYTKALAALNAGNAISYIGPTGSYGFDEAGNHPGNPETFCVGPAPGRAILSSGFSYDVANAKSVGTVTNCN